MALDSQNTFCGLFLVFESASCSPTIIFKGFVKTQKAAGLMELITQFTKKCLMVRCGSVVLPGNLGFLIIERFTC